MALSPDLGGLNSSRSEPENPGDHVTSGLDPRDALGVIQRETATSIDIARQSEEAEGEWADRGPIGLEHVEVVIDRVRNPHSMTDYACRVPDGRMGRVAIREVDGEWVAVCVL